MTVKFKSHSLLPKMKRRINNATYDEILTTINCIIMIAVCIYMYRFLQKVNVIESRVQQLESSNTFILKYIDNDR